MTRIPDYQTRIKAHLSDYKRARLGVDAEGAWKKTGAPYSHILPDALYRLNIIETFRAEFWQYLTGPTEVKLHQDFHHLNSSQAMGFNLLYPLALNGFLTEVFGATGDSVAEWAFEKVADHAEQTNFDFYVFLQSGTKFYFELKLSEGGFGAPAANEGRLAKLKDVYLPRLTGKVDDALLTEAAFFANYQLLRNLSYLDKARNDRLFLIFPFANAILQEEVNRLKPHVDHAIWEKVSVLDLEGLVTQILDRLDAHPMLQAHYLLFREKYILS